MKGYWRIPPEKSGAFVAAMEDILEVYPRPYNPRVPVVCMDEKPFQKLDRVRGPLPMRPGSVEKVDGEYKREGTCSVFIFTEPPGDGVIRRRRPAGQKRIGQTKLNGCLTGDTLKRGKSFW